MELPPDVTAIRDELSALAPRARALCATLDDDALHAPPAAGSWSVALCLEHLVVSAHVYLEPMRVALAAGRAAGRMRRGPIRPGWPSRLFLRQLEPPVKLKTPTLDVIRPAAQRAGDSARLTTLRDQLWQAIGALPGVYLNGHPQRRACHIVNVSVAGVDGESLLFAMRDLAVSSGAACAADSDEPSAVLRLLGRSPELAQAAVRFSLGRTTTADDVAGAAQQFIAAVRHLRRVAPAA